jgi:hypothetical protein
MTRYASCREFVTRWGLGKCGGFLAGDSRCAERFVTGRSRVQTRSTARVDFDHPGTALQITCDDGGGQESNLDGFYHGPVTEYAAMLSVSGAGLE